MEEEHPNKSIAIRPASKSSPKSLRQNPARADHSGPSSISTAVTKASRGQEESPGLGDVESDQLVSGDIVVTSPLISLYKKHNHHGEAKASPILRPSQSNYSVPSANPESLSGSRVNSQLVPHSGRSPPAGHPSRAQPSIGVRPDAVEVGKVRPGKIMVHLYDQ